MRVLLVSVNSHSRHFADPRKTPRQARSQATVDRILDTAARFFDERGYRGTTTNHVAEAAGVSVGSLYQYFPNKDALLTALALRHLDDALPALTELAARFTEDPVDTPTLARAIVEVSADLNPDDLHRLLRDAPHNDAVAERFAEIEELSAAFLAEHLRRTGHDAAQAELRARMAVEIVDALVHGTAIGAPGGIDEAVRVVTAVLDG